MLADTYAVIDIETTGLNPQCDRIIEIAAVLLRDGSVIDTFSTLVNPGISIPTHIQKLTGINNEMAGKAPFLPEVMGDFLDFTANAVPTGHNIAFDMSFFHHVIGFNNWNLSPLDTLSLSKILFPCLPFYRLDYLCNYFSLRVEGQHRALADALAAAELLKHLWQATLALDRNLLQKMLTIAPPSLESWLHSAVGLVGMPGTFQETAAGLFAAAETRRTAEIPDRDFSTDELISMLKPGGLLSSSLAGYEFRSQQVDMLKAVAGAFQEGCHLIVEAGTGTGKSLAYLLPAVFFSRFTGKKVAISTYTISLQEQLLDKDIPQILDILPFDIKAVLVKGRGNYLCRRKLHEYVPSLRSDDREKLFVIRLMRWAKLTASGDWNEMKTSPDEECIKHEFSACKDTCIGVFCSFYDSCFVNTARRQAEGADLLILNHSLLMEDIKMNNQLLPSFPILVIDEAHHLEEVATAHLGLTINQNSWDTIARRIGKSDHPLSFTGRTRNLLRYIHSTANDNSSQFLELLQDLEETVVKVRVHWDSFWKIINDITGKPSGQHYDSTVRFTAVLQESSLWHDLLNVFSQLEVVINQTATLLTRLGESSYHYNSPETAAVAENLSNMVRQCVSDLRNILYASRETHVCWSETDNYGNGILRAAPLEVGAILAETLYDRKKVVFTSATLTVNHDFSYYMKQVGLDLIPQELVATCRLESPFDYRSRALVCAIKELPDPGQMNDSEYARTVAPVLADLLPAVAGRTLVLCTSHRFIREMHKALISCLQNKDIVILAQGINGSRSQLLEEFKLSYQSVLLGASSFWEGIDLPGELLRCVVIPRLPFPSPGIPITAARMEHIAAAGSSSFLGFSLPQAVLRFRQGFGRLIRRADDYGAMVILDNRLVSKRYGKYFYQSLPPVSLTEVAAGELRDHLKEWFKKLTL